MRPPERLVAAWREVATVLGVEIEAPFSLVLPAGARVDAVLLVRRFGAPNGMLIVTDYDDVCSKIASVQHAGFGFSVLEEPEDGDAFVLNEYIEMLRDWGWTGAQENEPPWLNSQSRSADVQ